jgi:hypothetical protein
LVGFWLHACKDRMQRVGSVALGASNSQLI